MPIFALSPHSTSNKAFKALKCQNNFFLKSTAKVPGNLKLKKKCYIPKPSNFQEVGDRDRNPSRNEKSSARFGVLVVSLFGLCWEGIPKYTAPASATARALLSHPHSKEPSPTYEIEEKAKSGKPEGLTEPEHFWGRYLHVTSIQWLARMSLWLLCTASTVQTGTGQLWPHAFQA